MRIGEISRRHYEIPPDAKPEDWTHVAWAADGIQHIERLKGWGKWAVAWRVYRGSETVTRVRRRKVNLMKRTEKILEQGKALIRAIEALETIEPTGALERGMIWLLLQARRRRLRAIVGSAPTWMSEEILSASKGIEDDGPVLWRSDN